LNYFSIFNNFNFEVLPEIISILLLFKFKIFEKYSIISEFAFHFSGIALTFNFIVQSSSSQIISVF